MFDGSFFFSYSLFVVRYCCLAFAFVDVVRCLLLFVVCCDLLSFVVCCMLLFVVSLLLIVFCGLLRV